MILIENFAETASSWNILTVSKEKTSGSFPTWDNFAKTSWVAVIMWQPTASAWKIFKSSRGLAQISYARALVLKTFTASAMRGIGSLPVSATRPANTDTTLGVLAERHFKTFST